MADDYFATRQARCAECIETAMAVEAAVVADMKVLLEHPTLLKGGAEKVRQLLIQIIARDTAASLYYSSTKSSLLLQSLQSLCQVRGVKMPRALYECGSNQTPLGGVELTTGEVVIPLANGGEIRSGWIDEHDPDALPGGDYLSVIAPDGEQVFYEDSADVLVDPVEGRRKLWQFLLACLGGAGKDPTAPHEVGSPPPP